MHKTVGPAFVLLALVAWSASAHGGKIVVANDEWPLTNVGFSQEPFAQPTKYIQNVAQFFTGGGSGSFLIYSNNFGLTGSSLNNALTSAGHTLTYSTTIPFTLANLSSFNGVFLALPPTPPDMTALVNYVNAGGNVYIAAGTGIGGSATEAAIWNTFLNNFNLGLVGSSYNNINGTIPISSSHPIFAGVSALYQNNGNSIYVLNPSDPSAQILVTYQNQGLYAVYDSSIQSIPIPEPTTLALCSLGVISGWLCRRRLAKPRGSICPSITDPSC